MNTEPAQSPLDAANLSAARLSENDVLSRLFAPASNLPEPRNEQAIVVVAHGKPERAVTHHQIENLIAYAAEQLKERGVSRGDKVVFFGENCPEFTATILACWSLNAMVALIDYRAERKDVLEMSKKLGAKVLVTSSGLYKNYSQETQVFAGAGLDVLNVTPFADFKEPESTLLSQQFDLESLDLDCPAFAILTSGTTGAPKTSVHTLRSLVRNLIDLAEAADQQGEITALTPLPISHVFGLIVFLVSQVLGAKVVFTPLNPVDFVKAVHKHKPQWIAALPQFYGALLAAPDGYINLDNAQLLLCGGSPLMVSLADKFEETFGKKLNNGYGSTECKLVAFNKEGPVLSVGKPVGDIKINIVNDGDEILPEGKFGEVRITGSMLMDGYLDNEEESKKVLHDGHYYTGDIGRFEDGYLYVAGRKTDIIVVGGVVVNAGRIEEALRNNPEVKDVAVTAVKNKRLGQIVKASIVLLDEKIGDKLKSDSESEKLSAQRELQRRFRAFCKEQLPRYYRPMDWEFLDPHDSLPKTLAGKTDKKKM